MTMNRKAGRGRDPGPAKKSIANQDYTPIDRLLSRLDCVRQNGPDRWLTKCPAHEDRRPSLSIRVTDGDRILIHCFAGCSAADVVEAVGLNLSDLFPDQPKKHRYDPVRNGPMVPRDILRILYRDLFVISIAARWILDAAGDQVIDYSEKDYSTLERAIGRIQKTLELSGAVGGSINV